MSPSPGGSCARQRGVGTVLGSLECSGVCQAGAESTSPCSGRGLARADLYFDAPVI